ncbi:mycothiol transferase [Cellulomonas bogoriensis]|uniref:Mini-circle protein n=1 Tax=Cellulomonas bogoriensis 69B4 = DSM 16987 TaxID=1386082 RepID=A0A0A0BY63_9CELL|nr:DUF664 domain-containing protein [Cellulomonas bogoriensis]KGM12905.1 mini-circle protein [Cellulomonas bogoriensis 69B4 = DSM 16987]
MPDAVEGDLTPWEPPLAGSEIEHLLGSLTRLRTTFRWKTDALDTEGLSRTVGASTLTLGNLLKHLACAEDQKFGPSLTGAPYGPPWAGMPGYDGTPTQYTFDTRGHEPADLYRMWDEAVRRSDERLHQALRTGDLGQQVALAADEGMVVSLRRLLHDVVEEYGRHTGHADLIRESIDGLTGEDPPTGWSARSGTSPVGVQRGRP